MNVKIRTEIFPVSNHSAHKKFNGKICKRKWSTKNLQASKIEDINDDSFQEETQAFKSFLVDFETENARISVFVYAIQILNTKNVEETFDLVMKILPERPK